MTRVTGTFTSEGDVQQAVDRIIFLGVHPDAIRIINPPADTGGEPEAAPDDLEDGAAMVGIAGLGLAAGAAAGASFAGYGGMGYPAGPAAAVGAGVAAGALFSEGFGQVRGLGLGTEDTQLYHQRLSEGATVVAVDTNGELAEEVAAVMRRYHAADLRGG